MEIKYLLYIITLLELLAAIMATIHFKKYRASYEKYFLFFMWYTFLVDLTGGLIGDVFLMNNAWLYNAFIITSFLFYFNWYYTILRRSNFKKAVIAFTIIFSVVALFNLFFVSWKAYHSYTFFTGAAFLLVLTLFHFHQLLNSNEVLIVKHKLSFWISTGLLLFYMGMIPLIYLLKYIGIEHLSYLFILISLNVILYGCYTIGFIWTKKKYNHF
ncbi:hypothetical protein ATE92_0415 [Ulvibacter sp. MAR_2010_11]|uniref:hypothetical protein n=1 Tax=Ulvibacter sp. MAR_2010_11 TaxID=1250229 RepID=UPI000C2BCACE|nr:hypothetical protein [Ulvibacter sp. MAR_2010_11]PKA82287.1 hypothetical protein ATE92_0415 [Ulvibacter sp. MAR_2010_11]